MKQENYWSRVNRLRASRRRFLGTAGAAGVGTAGLALVGCGDDDDGNGNGNGDDPTPTTGGGNGETPGASPTNTAVPDDDEPVYGGTLRMGTFLDVLGIDPHIEVSVGLGTAARIYSYLGGFSTVENMFHPDLAESFETPDETTYTFTLNQGYNFQNVPPVDGREVTAEDVLYSLERFRDLPEAQNNDFFKTLVSMEAVDDYTFRVVLPAPNAEALIEIGGIQKAIVPREAVEEFGDLSSRGVGSGPYLFDEYIKGERERQVRNPDYFYSELPRLDAVERIVVLEMSTLIQAYQQGQLDINGALLTKLDFDGLPTDGFVNWTLPALHYGSLGVNASVEPFNNPMVRKALYLAIDRNLFVERLGFGDGLPMGPLSAGLDFWAISQDELAPYIGPDYEEARALLAAAGYEDGFDMTIETSGGVQLYIDHANIIVPELAKIGINAELNLRELGDYLSNVLFAANFDATVFTHNPYETPKIPLGFYHRDGIGGGSWWHYDNPDITAKIDAQQQELDADARLELVREVQIDILEDSAPLINCYSPILYGSYRDYVRGYDPSLRGYQAFRNTEWLEEDAQ